MMLLKDRVAVVTGGTRGIGYAIVKKYLENGAKVVLFGSKEESVNKAVQSLKAENPDWVVEGMWPNLTDSEEMEQAIAKVGESTADWIFWSTTPVYPRAPSWRTTSRRTLQVL